MRIDPESSDAGGDDPEGGHANDDLSPRILDAEATGRRVGPTIVLLVVGVAIAAILFQGLRGATLSLNEANEAVAEREGLGERRFRLLGSPISASDSDRELRGESVALFTVACDGVAVDVAHVGNVAESFQMGVPVVLEGRWQRPGSATSEELQGGWVGGADDGWVFESDLMLVKHDNDYRTDRIEQAASCGTDAVDAPGA